jgi:D-amino-acid dehydrogenase
MPTMPERSVADATEHGLRITGIAEFFTLTRRPRRARGIFWSTRRLHSRPASGEVYDVVGPRPSTPDSLPVISTDPRHPTSILRSATVRVRDGRITGKLVAEPASGRPPSIDVSPFSIQRFN